MSPGLADLNTWPQSRARAELLGCCGSARWAGMMTAARPFTSYEAMAEAADVIWRSLELADWLEAFAAHPQIGATTGGAGTASGWAADEQSGMHGASDTVRDRLAAANRAYHARFGYIFIACATGKTAEEMLAMLERRLSNEPDAERAIAAEEQRKITQLRLAKLLT